MSYRVLTRTHPTRAFEFQGFATRRNDESFEQFLRRVAEQQCKPIAWIKVKPTEVH